MPALIIFCLSLYAVRLISISCNCPCQHLKLQAYMFLSSSLHLQTFCPVQLFILHLPLRDKNFSI
uniref:Uncharacterized protein n=1 Tax=Arundo donax TaxID=35708 RepID=A0A0A8Z0F1_ARUDO